MMGPFGSLITVDRVQCELPSFHVLLCTENIATMQSEFTALQEAHIKMAHAYSIFYRLKRVRNISFSHVTTWV